jgi:hypothetical protein
LKILPAFIPVPIEAAIAGSVIAWIAGDKLVFGLKLAAGGPKGINVLMLSETTNADDSVRRVPGDLRTMPTRQVLNVPDATIEPSFEKFKLRGGENSARGELEIREGGRVLMKTRSDHADVEDFLVDLDSGEMVPFRTLPYTDKVFPLIAQAWSLVRPVRYDPTKREVLVTFPSVQGGSGNPG